MVPWRIGRRGRAPLHAPHFLAPPNRAVRGIEYTSSGRVGLSRLFDFKARCLYRTP
uniref:Uncharacterized protein n=2 Tax=unclassified Caudoviricetes TaxID=2788787 RepID=A0A8S5UU62_9CAUD|nr:MAG TPA: hypothetical protein [Myoviridae sp. ctGgs6]DAF98031.1 MAG TPA: hypothetical protein [Myoviridae sp. ctUKl33]